MSKDHFNSDFDLTALVSTTSVIGGTGAAPSTVLQAGCAGVASKTKPGRSRRARPAFSLEWAAGFADGEASIFIYKQAYPADPGRNSAYRLGFAISQNDLQVLEHFKDGLGVHSAIYPSRRSLQHNKQVYELRYTGVNALKTIALLQPYLIRKQAEAQVAIQYWQRCGGGGHPGPAGWPAAIQALRERFCKKLKALK